MGLLSTIGRIGGAAIGFATGGPAGAITGFQVGGAVGKGIQGGSKATKLSRRLAEQYANLNLQNEQRRQGFLEAATNPASPEFQRISGTLEDNAALDFENALRRAMVQDRRQRARSGYGFINPERRDESFLQALARGRANLGAQADVNTMNFLLNAAGQRTDPGAISTLANTASANDLTKSNANAALLALTDRFGGTVNDLLGLNKLQPIDVSALPERRIAPISIASLPSYR